MSRRDKLRQKLRNNPKGVKFSDLETLLIRFGFTLVRVRGSHHVFQFKDEEIESILIVPVHGNNVKTPYVKEAIEILDRLFPETAEDADEDDIDEQDD